MSQNKELKRDIAELQDAFVKLSQQNMELASELESENRRVTFLKAQMATPTTPAQSATPTSFVQTPPAVETTPTLGGSVEGDIGVEETGGSDEEDTGITIGEMRERETSLYKKTAAALLEEKQQQINVSSF